MAKGAREEFRLAIAFTQKFGTFCTRFKSSAGRMTRSCHRNEGRMNVGDLVSVDELEREHIRLVISKTKNLGEAARVLGIDAATLYRKRKRWKLDEGDQAGAEQKAAPSPEPAHAAEH